MRFRPALILLLVVLFAFPLVSAVASTGSPIWNPSFQRTWARTDQPVSDLGVSRTWMWGPAGYSGGVVEPYAEAKGGKRIVQYFDKSRMEISSDPTVSPDSAWYVTNGLLAKELITGKVQVGDNKYWSWEPAQIPVAGDAVNPVAPTYATFGMLLGARPATDGQTLTTRVWREGRTTHDAQLAKHGVTAGHRVQVWGIDHQVASVFWEFMNSSGLVLDGGKVVQGKLFQDPFYATGYPITEAYWARVKLAGVDRDVLIQCFERRCLTYTPDNPAGWQVEAGNIGQHYYRWRYADKAPVPAPIG
ncbi:MAG TPA: hypothetical protein PLR44_05330 [Thermomicrobiales bacterium]|nr:hypothetical protein [Chloroflexota bacterium]HBY46611.1 hypothetical protein [Chloroflexota bacterium]HCG28455.1 hypothetical protein [Chloroflexota bacterium]HQZ89456.1 hypothetical protein [Thermomicrobiales bacterium]HRA32621.1 hypothetical protein [Thermomicrobiales bacterium]